MNWKTWIPLVLAIVLGLIAAKAGRDILIRAQHAGVSNGQYVKVVVAKQDLEPGKTLAESDLALAAAPAENVPRSVFQNAPELVGRVVLFPIVKNQALIETMLAPAGAGTGLQALIPQGMRAASIEMNETNAVGGLLVPGCRVDVVSTLTDDRINQAVSRTIVENAKVVAVGRCVSGSGKEESDTSRAKSVTLVVWPREAEAIELAANAGRVRLVLRSALDAATEPTRGVTVAELLGGERKKPEPVVVSVPASQPTTVVRPEITSPVKNAEPRLVEVI